MGYRLWVIGYRLWRGYRLWVMGYGGFDHDGGVAEGSDDAVACGEKFG